MVSEFGGCGEILGGDERRPDTSRAGFALVEREVAERSLLAERLLDGVYDSGTVHVFEDLDFLS
jgi:hypothetical protein